jgi:hypothetical protein
MKFSYSPGLVKRSSSVKVEVTTLSTSHLPPNGFIVSQISLSLNDRAEKPFHIFICQKDAPKSP